MSRRTERVASLIRSILARAIQTQLHDPRIPVITSITRVEVSADFSIAKIYVSVMAPDSRRELAIKALQSSAGHLRWLLGRELDLRKLPALVFKHDESVRKTMETLAVIDRLNMEQVGAVDPEALEGEDELDDAFDHDQDLGEGDHDAGDGDPDAAAPGGPRGDARREA